MLTLIPQTHYFSCLEHHCEDERDYDTQRPSLAPLCHAFRKQVTPNGHQEHRLSI